MSLDSANRHAKIYCRGRRVEESVVFCSKKRSVGTNSTPQTYSVIAGFDLCRNSDCTRCFGDRLASTWRLLHCASTTALCMDVRTHRYLHTPGRNMDPSGVSREADAALVFNEFKASGRIGKRTVRLHLQLERCGFVQSTNTTTRLSRSYGFGLTTSTTTHCSVHGPLHTKRRGAAQDKQYSASAR